MASLLNNTPQEKAVVRSVFLSILAAGSQVIRNNELLTPVELLTLLHHSEKEAGLKSTIEGALSAPSSLTHAVSLTNKIPYFLITQPSRFVSLCPMLSEPRSWPPSCSMSWKSQSSPSCSYERSVNLLFSPLQSLTHSSSQTPGHPSRDNVQGPSTLHLNDALAPPRRETSLDDGSTLGRLHSLCQGDCAPFVPSAASTAEGTTSGRCGEAAFV